MEDENALVRLERQGIPVYDLSKQRVMVQVPNGDQESAPDIFHSLDKLFESPAFGRGALLFIAFLMLPPAIHLLGYALKYMYVGINERLNPSCVESIEQQSRYPETPLCVPDLYQ